MLTNLFYTINFSFAIVVSIIALFFGFLTIIIVVSNRQCRNVTNLLTCNSATAIIFYYILNLISSIYGLRDDWSYNQPACVFRAYCLVVSCAIICYSYLFQAISRLFFAVFYTHRSLLTYRVHWLMIIVNWLIGTTVPILPVFIGNGYGFEEESRLCTITTKIFSTSMYSVITAFVIPLNIVCVIYGTIFYYARQSTRRVVPFEPSVITTTTTIIIPRPNIKREMKLMKNILILVGIFTCAGTPYFILVLWHVTQHKPPESFYLLIINSISFFTSLMTITLFWMSREVKKCTLVCLRKLI